MTGAPSGIRLTPAEARRLAVAASHLDPAPDGPRDLAGVLDRLRIVQLDSISTLARAHQLTLTARLPQATGRAVDRTLEESPPIAFEYPAHALALVPLADWPLWAFRRRATRRRPEYPDRAARDRVTALLREHGPLRLRDLRDPDETPGQGWNWGATKRAVEFMLWAGDLVCVRRSRWQRLIDLPERHLPAALHTDALTDDACLTALLQRAGRALGVATTSDLSDYLRIPPRQAGHLLPRTCLRAATVEGWDEPTWIHPEALPPPPAAPAPARFLGPFDNLIWHRPRTRRLFAFTHLFEAYKPAPRRVHGYYVCPLLSGDRLIARADLARTGDTLTVRGFHPEATAPRGHHLGTALAQACAQLTAALELHGGPVWWR